MRIARLRSRHPREKWPLAKPPPLDTYETRAPQMFPRLSDEELARLGRFGEPVSFRAGDVVAKVGEVGRGLLLVTAGQVEVTRHERGASAYIVTHERGNFM